MASDRSSSTGLWALCLGLFVSSLAYSDEFFVGFHGPSVLRGEPGDVVLGTYDVTFFHHNPEGNQLASSYSMSMVADGAAIISITAEVTDAQVFDFDQTELAPAAGSVDECTGLDGAITATICGLICSVALAAEKTFIFARIQVEAQVPKGGTGLAVLRFADGCRGSGQPVDTVITQGGDSALPTKVPFQIALGLPPFVRGDGNGDARVDIADPIWILNELFRGGPESPCRDASDANDDGAVDIADALFLIRSLLPTTFPESARFAPCGVDPSDTDGGEGDGIGCDRSTVCF